MKCAFSSRATITDLRGVNEHVQHYASARINWRASFASTVSSSLSNGTHTAAISAAAHHARPQAQGEVAQQRGEVGACCRCPLGVGMGRGDSEVVSISVGRVRGVSTAVAVRHISGEPLAERFQSWSKHYLDKTIQ